MFKNKSIIIGFATILIVFLGGTYLYLKTIITQESLRAKVVEIIEDNLEGTSAQIGSLNYSIGGKVRVDVNNLIIKNSKAGSTVSEVGNVYIKIPVLSLLFGSGTIDFKLKDTKVMSYNLPVKKGVTTLSENKPVKLKLPRIIEEVKFDIRGYNIEIATAEDTVISFSKIVLKDLNFKDTTAYEIVSKVKLADTSFDLSLIGELALDKLIKNEAVSGKTKILISEFSNQSSHISLSPIQLYLKYVLQPSGELSFELEPKKDNQFQGNLSGVIGDEVKVSANQFKLNLNIALELIGKDIVQSSVQNWLVLDGDIIKDNSTLTADLSLEVEKQLSVKVGKSTLGFIPKIQYSSGVLYLDVKGNLNQKGSIKLTSSTSLDIENPPSSLDGLNTIEFLLESDGLELDPLLNSSTDEKQVSESTQAPIEKTVYPKLSGEVKLKNSRLLAQNLNVNLLVNSKADRLSIKSIVAEFGKSTHKGSIEMVDTKTSFKINSQNFDLASLQTMMPSFLEGTSGKLSGTNEGFIDGENFRVTTNSYLTNGEIKKLKLKTLFADFFEKIDRLKKTKDVSISDRFERLELNLVATPILVNANRIYFVGKDKDLILDLKGDIHLKNTPSELHGGLILSKSSSSIEKKTGDSTIPLKLAGVFPTLKPQIQYTLGKLAKNSVKNETKKIKDKIETKLKDKAKKFFKGLKL